MHKLTIWILYAMGLGLLAGLLLNWGGEVAWLQAAVTDGILHVAGQAFLSLLMVLVIPVVVVSLVAGTAALDDVRRLGRLGFKTVAFYLATTAIAVGMALVAAIVLGPGRGFDFETAVEVSVQAPPPLTEVLIDLFPRNFFAAAAEGNILQIIVFSILFGIAMTMAGKPGKRILEVFNDLMEVVMKLVTIIMWMAPIGVFALIARVFATQGLDALAPMAKYVLLVLAVLLVQAFVVYPIFLKGIGGLNPRRFIEKIWPVQVFAFSTASSAATIPISLRTAEKRLGVTNAVASFTIPLGATINMNGTAAMQGIATVFIAQAFGVELGIGEYLMVILTATLAAIGTAGVPGAGLIMLAMVLQQAGLPVEGIAIVYGVDRIVDMARTAVNITGDAVVTCIVAQSEGQLDRARYDTPLRELQEAEAAAAEVGENGGVEKEKLPMS